MLIIHEWFETCKFDIVIIRSWIANSAGMCDPQAEREMRELMMEEKNTRAVLKNTMDPLLSRLSKDFVNDTDLHVKLSSLFEVFVLNLKC